MSNIVFHLTFWSGLLAFFFAFFFFTTEGMTVAFIATLVAGVIAAVVFTRAVMRES